MTATKEIIKVNVNIIAEKKSSEGQKVAMQLCIAILIIVMPTYIAIYINYLITFCLTYIVTASKEIIKVNVNIIR